MQTAIKQAASTQAVAGTQGASAHVEPLPPHKTSGFAGTPVNVRKRIGSTVYEVRVYFNQDAKETMNDKIMRLIRNDIERGKAV